MLRPIFIHITDEEVTERLNRLEDKILNYKKLNADEALGIAFLPIFSSGVKQSFLWKNFPVIC